MRGGIAAIAVLVGIGSLSPSSEEVAEKCESLLAEQTKVVSEYRGALGVLQTMMEQASAIENFDKTQESKDFSSGITSIKKFEPKEIKTCEASSDQEKIEKLVKDVREKNKEIVLLSGRVETATKEFKKNKEEYDAAIATLTQKRDAARALYESSNGAVQDNSLRELLKSEADVADALISKEVEVTAVGSYSYFLTKAQESATSLDNSVSQVNAAVEAKKAANAKEAEQRPAKQNRQRQTKQNPVQPAPAPAGQDKPNTGRHFANCAEARAAGAAPIHKGEPGYRKALDRDGDGIACDK